MFFPQCPIEPHDSFTYIFNTTDKGTYWYHSHIGNLRVMGLNGALIVKEKDDTMEEHVLMIQVHFISLLYLFVSISYFVFTAYICLNLLIRY